MNNYYEYKHYSQILRPSAPVQQRRHQPEVIDIKDDTEDKGFEKDYERRAQILLSTGTAAE
jgi:hypothetical protein